MNAVRKRRKFMIILALVLFVGLAIFWLVSTSRAAIETPDYIVIRKDGKFEIRDYPALTVATTPMEGADMNGGFRQLFRFITGRNEGTEKIAMTSPVLVDTAQGRKTMSFIMPKKTVEKGVPKPAGEGVSLEKVPAARNAVLRFSGGRTAKNEANAIGKINEWLAAQKIVGKSDPIFAYYDPPWTPTFFRRNEVMIRIDRPAGNP
jgi:DNA gyrase inhibitor GyrI